MLGYKIFQSGLDHLPTAAIVTDVGNGIVAAGANQSAATALTNATNEVATVAAATGVRLYAGTAGDAQLVYNGGANNLSVYPDTGAQIDALGLNNPFTLNVGKTCLFTRLTSTQWVGLLSA